LVRLSIALFTPVAGHATHGPFELTALVARYDLFGDGSYGFV
jgi:hypothetical protein